MPTLDQHRAVAMALRARDPGLAGQATHAHFVQITRHFETLAQDRPALFSA